MLRYSDEIIEEIRQNNDVVDIISQYVHLTRKGRNYFGLCPFHNEKSPSFSVSPDRQIFHCFGCGVGGNVYTFLMKIEGITFKEALEQLAERANIQLPTLTSGADTAKEELKAKVYKVNEFTAEFYHQNLYKPNAKMAQEYVKKRKLNQETLEAYKIGFSGKFDELYKALKQQGFGEKEILESGLVNKNDNGTYIDRYRNRLMFPICDARGKVIAFGGRVLDDSKPKYINSPENIVYSKGRHLFGLNVAKKYSSKKLLIVEGYMDVISLHQRGIENVVGALGTALTEQQGWLLRKSTEQVILGFDADGAGQTAVARSMEILQNMGCDMRVLQIEGAKDPDEFIVKFGEGRFKLAMENAISLVEFKVKNLRKDINLENAADKIKFLNEIAKILAKVENTIEREIYIEKIKKGQYEEAKNIVNNLFCELKNKLIVEKPEKNVFDDYNIDYEEADIESLTFVKYGFWDMIFQNIFYIDKQYYFYDQEWLDNNVPIEYIIYRAMLYNQELSQLINKDELFANFNIKEPQIKLFRELDNKLQEKTRDEKAWNIHLHPITINTLLDKEIKYEEEIQKLKIDKDQITQECTKLLNEKDARIKYLEDNIAETVNLLHAKERRIELMEESTSWRITEPLRWLRRNKKGKK